MKSLASVRDAIDILEDKLNGDYVHYIFPAFHQMKIDADKCHDQPEIKTLYMTGHVEWTKYIRQHSNLLENCALLSENISLVESIDEIQNDLMPQWYWSTAIPLVVLIVSIAWLTAVESGSLRLMRAIGHCFISAVLFQVIIQFAFIAHFHGKYTSLMNRMDEPTTDRLHGKGIHWSIWVVFIVYAIFNVYAIPIIITYMTKRSHNEHSILTDNMEKDEPKYPNSYNRMGVRNRSFRIEDDPMGDNFRQSLEDIRVGVRETVPKTPALSRVTSLTEDPIKEEDEDDLASQAV